MKKMVQNYFIITVASILYAVGVGSFIDPNNLAPGGVTGIAIILNRISGIETGTLILLVNIPIILLGIWKFGFHFILSTFYCILLTSWMINVLEQYPPATANPILAALAGSALVAAGIGWILKAGSTTGGIDIIVKLMRLRFPHLKTGVLFLIMDFCVVALSAVVFHNVDAALYGAVAVIVNAMVLDIVLYGRDKAKLIYIISDHSESITARLLQELDIGVTHIRGRGAYSGREKDVIMCVVRKPLAPRAEAIVKEEDALAFMIVTGATEIYGEGYKSYFSEKL